MNDPFLSCCQRRTYTRESSLRPQSLKYAGIKWKLIEPLKLSKTRHSSYIKRNISNQSCGDYITAYNDAKPIFNNSSVSFTDQEQNIISNAKHPQERINAAPTMSRISIAKSVHQSFIESEEKIEKSYRQKEEKAPDYFDEGLISPRYSESKILDEVDQFTGREEVKEITVGDPSKDVLKENQVVDPEQIKAMIYDGLKERVMPKNNVRCAPKGLYQISSNGSDILPILSYGCKRLKRVVADETVPDNDESSVSSILNGIDDPREQNCFALNLMRKRRGYYF